MAQIHFRFSAISVDNRVNACYNGTPWLAHPIPLHSASREVPGGASSPPSLSSSRRQSSPFLRIRISNRVFSSFFSLQCPFSDTPKLPTHRPMPGDGLFCYNRLVDGLHPISGAAPEVNMSVVPPAAKSAGNGKVTVPDILHRKISVSRSTDSHSQNSPREPQKITCLTAYDYPAARLLDEAGVDILLVGDSLGMVVLGYENTLPVTAEEMLHHV